MSKLGRYSADRKKIETLDTDKTVTVADCGTIFILNSGSDAISGRSGQYTVTLPALNDAGNGWWCKFVLAQTSGGDVAISGSSSDTTPLNVHIAAVASGSDAGAGDGTAHAGGKGNGQAPLASAKHATFDVSACAVNDTLELVTNGSAWYGQAIVSGGAAITDSI